MRPEKFFDESLFERNSKLFNNRFSIVLERYLSDFEGYLNEIKIGLDENDLNKIAEAAHALKSSSSTLGLKGAGELAGDLEHITRQGTISNAIIKSVQELSEAYQLTKSELTKRFDDIAC